MKKVKMSQEVADYVVNEIREYEGTSLSFDRLNGMYETQYHDYVKLKRRAEDELEFIEQEAMRDTGGKVFECFDERVPYNAEDMTADMFQRWLQAVMKKFDTKDEDRIIELAGYMVKFIMKSSVLNLNQRSYENIIVTLNESMITLPYDLSKENPTWKPVIKGSWRFHNVIEQAHEIIAKCRGKKKLGKKKAERMVLAEETLEAAGIRKRTSFNDPDEPHRCIIGDMLFPEDSMGELFGQRQNFKSFFAMQAALCVSHGLKFNGMDVIEGNVVYVAFEGFKGLKKRFKAMAKHLGVKLDDSKLRIINAEDQKIDLKNEDDVKRLAAELESFGHSQILFIDTLRAAGVENMTSGAGWVEVRDNIRTLLRGNVASNVTWLAHANKSNNESGDKGRLDDADFAYKITRKKNTMAVKLESVKSKDFKPFKPIMLRFQETSNGNGLVLSDDAAKNDDNKPKDDVKKTQLLSEVDSKIKKYLKEHPLPKDGIALSHVARNIRGVKLDDVKSYFENRSDKFKLLTIGRGIKVIPR